MSGLTERGLRQRVRELLRICHPDDPDVDQFAFRGAQFDHGLALVHFPEGSGGLGLSAKMQRIINDELENSTRTHYRDLTINLIGIGMAAPTILTYANPDLRLSMLRPIFTGQEIWCQLFSEPGAGSDVSALATRAVASSDGWVVNGQKVWTTFAHQARWGMLLARTDPDLPKHKGLTYFILDMQAPGVDVRPLYQITGEAEFNEVFLTDVKISDAHRLGDRGNGWKVAITTLMNERVAIGGGRGPRRKPIDFLIDLWREQQKSETSQEQPVLRDRIAGLVIEARLLDVTSRRAAASRKNGNPGPEGSVGKLAIAELNQRIFQTCMEVLGPKSLTYNPGYELRRPGDATYDLPDRAMHRYLRSRSATIEGGTSEIMRNILGERVLGLPPEPQEDRNKPWSEIRRGN